MQFYFYFAFTKLWYIHLSANILLLGRILSFCYNKSFNPCNINIKVCLFGEKLIETYHISSLQPDIGYKTF